ncbi:MAG: hypoxanthine phosphoribosyltransferase [Elusimicrobia bacterium RIFOXYA2_FULL_50_26]|nr:MAG: hypoxanthine phosphoribosyltransferase [Elusimicrobia bacterium RIFOXYA2_FULL_50_26]OGS22362.1 MAG: hypoxanthine phosphoribosyltransferase [Elusimicrobia bacterium RIFOXYB2_FULL_50_12]
MEKDIDRVLLSSEQINERVAELAREISAWYGENEVVIIPVLEGGAMFSKALSQLVNMPHAICPIKLSSYQGARSTKTVKLLEELSISLAGRDVLIVEDIVDTGYTLNFLQSYLRSRGVASLRTCVLLDKVSAREVHVDINYTGFIIPDEFVVGFGLDYRQRYRELPFVGILKREIYDSRST